MNQMPAYLIDLIEQEQDMIDCLVQVQTRLENSNRFSAADKLEEAIQLLIKRKRHLMNQEVW